MAHFFFCIGKQKKSSAPITVLSPKTFRSIGGLSREHRRFVGVMSQSGYRFVIDWSSCVDVVFRVRGDRQNAKKSRVNLLSIRSCPRLALVSHTSRVMRKWQMSCRGGRKALQRYSKISRFANNCLRKSQQKKGRVIAKN